MSWSRDAGSKFEGRGGFVVIYRGDPLWVAPLGGEVRTVLSRENPFFEHAEASCSSPAVRAATLAASPR